MEFHRTILCFFFVVHFLSEALRNVNRCWLYFSQLYRDKGTAGESSCFLPDWETGSALTVQSQIKPHNLQPVLYVLAKVERWNTSSGFLYPLFEWRTRTCSHSETLLWQTTFQWDHFKIKYQVLYCFKSVFHFETGYCTAKPGLHHIISPSVQSFIVRLWWPFVADQLHLCWATPSVFQRHDDL